MAYGMMANIKSIDDIESLRREEMTMTMTPEMLRQRNIGDIDDGVSQWRSENDNMAKSKRNQQYPLTANID